MVFQSEKKSYSLLIYIGILLILIVFFLLSLKRLEDTNFEKSCVVLSEAVRKSVVHCYAIEGQYPENIEYLESNYGLNYNKKRFMVHYQVIGSNLMPDIFVTGSENLYDRD